MNILLVGGVWDSGIGRRSGVVEKLTNILQKLEDKGIFCGYNGGNYQLLRDSVRPISELFDVVIWMPDIDNGEEKLLNQIKANSPTTLLVQSKRMDSKGYTNKDLIQRLLKSHAGLGIAVREADVSEDKAFSLQLVDPLGNCYVETTDLEVFAYSLHARIKEIRSFTRQRSIYAGLVPENSVNPVFVDVVKEVAGKFTPLVAGASPERFLGNASTRCSFGFPAERLRDGLAVSKRNVNKEMLTKDQFVVVEPETVQNSVLYYGPDKPSVDAPIQVELFKQYSNVRYMIHGHVYVEGAPTTDRKIPCGCLEEVEEVLKLYPDTNITNFSVNLLGHGCIMFADNVDYFLQQQFKARPFLEE